MEQGTVYSATIGRPGERRAVGIGERTGERLMTKPGVRDEIEKKRKANTSLMTGVPTVIQDLLTATNTDGTPNLGLRAKGVELAAKNYQLLMGLDEDDVRDALPEGVYRVYPLPTE